MKVRFVALLAIVCASVLQGQAMALAPSFVAVAIYDTGFTPENAKLPLSSDGILWGNEGTKTHTSTSDGFDGTDGVKLWKSGDIAPNDAYNFGPDAAGTYPYHCSIHPRMRGKVKVPLVARNITYGGSDGHIGDLMAIDYANSDGIHDGFSLRLQMAKPGKDFENLGPRRRPDDSGTEAFIPQVNGVYKFRARLLNDFTDGKSDWSPVLKVTISPDA
jgi:plastocyanin